MIKVESAPTAAATEDPAPVSSSDPATASESTSDVPPQTKPEVKCELPPVITNPKAGIKCLAPWSKDGQ